MQDSEGARRGHQNRSYISKFSISQGASISTVSRVPLFFYAFSGLALLADCAPCFSFTRQILILCQMEIFVLRVHRSDSRDIYPHLRYYGHSCLLPAPKAHATCFPFPLKCYDLKTERDSLFPEGAKRYSIAIAIIRLLCLFFRARRNWMDGVLRNSPFWFFPITISIFF